MALSRTDFGPYQATPPQGTGPFTTSSLTPPASSKLYVKVAGGIGTPANINDYVLSDSAGNVYTKEEQAVITLTGDGSFLQVWSTDIGPSPVAMTLTITHTGNSSHAMYIEAHAFETDQPGATIETGTKVSGSQTGSAVSRTLPQAPLASSVVMAWAAAITANADGSGSSIVPGGSGGFTGIAQAYANNSFMRTQSQFRNSDTGTTVDWTVTANNTPPFDQRLMAAVEVQEILDDGEFVFPADPFSLALAVQAVTLKVSRRIDAEPLVLSIQPQNVTITYSGIEVVGGRPNLFGANIAATLAAAMGPLMLSATLIRKTAGARAPGDLTGGRNTGAQTDSYSCRGFVDEYNQRHIGAARGREDRTLIQAGDRKITLFGGTLPTAIDPRPGDLIRIEGATYTIVGPVKRDPAGATFECQGRR